MATALRWSGLAALVFAGLLLGALWDSVPATWTVHWGAGLRADGWARKSVVSAVSPLAVGFSVWMTLELLASMAERSGTIPALARASAMPPRVAAFATAVLCSALAVWLPLGEPQPSFLLGASLVWMTGTVALSVLHIVRVTRRLKREGAPGLEGYTGIIYRNSADPRFFVQKPAGLGYTINFAHPRALLVLSVLLLPGVLLIALLLIAG